MTDNLIDLTELFNQKHVFGIKALKSIPAQTAETIINFILSITLAEVSVGLGLEEADDDVNLDIYKKINELYEASAGGCYFCSNNIDPNETQFDSDTIICLMCRMKLANFIQALGVDPGRVFTGMRQRKVQTARIKIK